VLKINNGSHENKDVDSIDEDWVTCRPLAASSHLISFSNTINIIINFKAWTLWSVPSPGSTTDIGRRGYYRRLYVISTNLGQHRLTWHRSALPANPTSSRPRSWSLGNEVLVAAERSEGRRVLGTSKPRPSAKEAHPYRKRACLEALRLATTTLTQPRTGYPSWGHPTHLRICRGI
jgi:hypothetical protein